MQKLWHMLFAVQNGKKHVLCQCHIIFVFDFAKRATLWHTPPLFIVLDGKNSCAITQKTAVSHCHSDTASGTNSSGRRAGDSNQ